MIDVYSSSNDQHSELWCDWSSDLFEYQRGACAEIERPPRSGIEVSITHWLVVSLFVHPGRTYMIISQAIEEQYCQGHWGCETSQRAVCQPWCISLWFARTSPISVVEAMSARQPHGHLSVSNSMVGIRLNKEKPTWPICNHNVLSISPPLPISLRFDSKPYILFILHLFLFVDIPCEQLFFFLLCGFMECVFLPLVHIFLITMRAACTTALRCGSLCALSL